MQIISRFVAHKARRAHAGNKKDGGADKIRTSAMPLGRCKNVTGRPWLAYYLPWTSSPTVCLWQLQLQKYSYAQVIAQFQCQQSFGLYLGEEAITVTS
jgi:hypothetical protein